MTSLPSLFESFTRACVLVVLAFTLTLRPLSAKDDSSSDPLPAPGTIAGQPDQPDPTDALPSRPPAAAPPTPAPETVAENAAGPRPTESTSHDTGSNLSSLSGLSSNAMVNLVNLLIAQHVITKEAGDALIKQAELEAEQARSQAESAQTTAERALAVQTAPVSGASGGGSSSPSALPMVEPSSSGSFGNSPGLLQVPVTTSAGGGSASSGGSSGGGGGDDVAVNYVPDVVKNQIRDEVTEEVLKREKDEHWTANNDVPDWVKHLRISGDVRVRYEGDFFPSGNAAGQITNYNAINTGNGSYTVGSALYPKYNVDQGRNRFRLRARLGAEVDLGHGFSVGLRLATGSDDNPVTENQTLGGANSAQGGNFGKYNVWLDRAFIRYENDDLKDTAAIFNVGRMDNPFFHTSMIWADDLGFDGADVQVQYKGVEGVTPFFVAGGFPVFNTDYNFSSNQDNKFSSEDKYLLAGQLGTAWDINKDFTVKVAASYYYFSSIEGKVSAPISSDSLPGNTDDSRPSFAQNGNTYVALRDYEDPSNPTHAGEQQYFGLATPFHEFAFTGRIDYNGFDPFHIWMTGEMVKNLAFDRTAILNAGSPNLGVGPFNNLSNGSDPTSFDGGDLGWMVRLNLGKVALEKFGDWNFNASYRYVESDATVDAFTDADFGGPLTGTNLKGYTLGVNLALAPKITAGLTWMSADAIAGPTYKNDLIQVDLNAKF